MTHINIIGWYNRGNAGDEAFRYVFETILFPGQELIFTTGAQWKPGGRTIIGGGDVVHSFYTRHIPAGEKVELLGVGLGSNYELAIEALAHLEVVSACVRSRADAAFLTSRGYATTYAPDLVLQHLPPVVVERTNKIGICLTGCYDQDVLAHKIIAEVGRDPIVWISLSSDKNHNDVAMNERFVQQYGGEHWVSDSTQQYLTFFGSLKFVYTNRLHSMVFCDIQKTPFVQLSRAKKFYDYLGDQQRLFLIKDL